MWADYFSNVETGYQGHGQREVEHVNKNQLYTKTLLSRLSSRLDRVPAG